MPPLVFNMLMANLSQGFHLAERRGQLDIYKIVGTTSITHLLFIVDVLCFAKANQKSMMAIKHVINDFQPFIGLQVNVRKGSFTFSMVVIDRQCLLDIMGFTEGALPIRYIGVPTMGRELQLVDCEGLVGQHQAYLACWKNQAIFVCWVYPTRQLGSDGLAQLLVSMPGTSKRDT